MPEPLILAVDIGNHRTKIAPVRVWQGESLTDSVELGPVHLLDRQDSLESLRRWCGSRSARWLISSVHADRALALEQWITARETGDTMLRLSAADVPLAVEVEAPHRVGMDRLCAALGGYACAQGRPVVVVDAGSAITVDAVSAQGAFLGGTIFLGLHGALQHLARVGSALPQLDLAGTSLEITPLGKSTDQAILSGVVLAAAGGVNELVARIQATGREIAQVYVTGGDAAVLEPWFRFDHVRIDDLVLRGAVVAGRAWLAAQATVLEPDF